MALAHEAKGAGPVRIELTHPFAGAWQVRNSPVDRVPSHGTTRFASAHAIDVVPVGGDERTAPLTWRSLLRPEPPQRFPGFGRAIVSPVAGQVVAAHDSEPDHATHRGMPSLRSALTQGRRAVDGWPALAGNHVMIRCEGGVVALCHLQRSSVAVRVGELVVIGQPVACCGNSGNSTEPHVYVQAIDRLPVEAAQAVRITFGGRPPRNGEIVEG